MRPECETRCVFSSFADQVEQSVRSTLDNLIGSATYDSARVPEWVDTLTASVLDNLQKMGDSFKYVVNVVVLQKCSSGFHLFSTCYWDQTLDGTVTIQWENKSFHCIVTVFGISL